MPKNLRTAGLVEIRVTGACY